MTVSCVCLQCGSVFERFPRGIKRGEGKYCSRKCLDESRKRSGNLLYMPDGYIKVYQSGGRMIPEHRLVMQNHLGRELRDDELVHHIDGNKANNDISNLQIVSAKEHTLIHCGLNGRWALEHEACVECNTTEHEHASNGLCRSCYNKHYLRAWRQKYPGYRGASYQRA